MTHLEAFRNTITTSNKISLLVYNFHTNYISEEAFKTSYIELEVLRTSCEYLYYTNIELDIILKLKDKKDELLNFILSAHYPISYLQSFETDAPDDLDEAEEYYYNGIDSVKQMWK